MEPVAEINRMKDTDLSAAGWKEYVQQHLERYFSELGDAEPSNIYDSFCQLIEKPMIEVILHKTRYNQSKTAVILGISRGTLHKKMKAYGLLKSSESH